MRPLTQRMIDVLRAFDVKGDYVEPMTPNEIGSALGFHTGHLQPHGCNHAGRVMGPAQRVIFTLIGLRDRGLISMERRRDGLSGTAYKPTRKGLNYIRQIGSGR